MVSLGVYPRCTNPVVRAPSSLTAVLVAALLSLLLSALPHNAILAAQGTAVTCAPAINSTTISCQDPNATCASIFMTSGGASVIAASCETSTGSNESEVMQCTCLPTPSSPVNNSNLTVSIVRNMSTSVCSWNATVDFYSDSASSVSPTPTTNEDDFVGFVCSPTSGRCPTRLDCRNLSSSYAATCANGMLSCDAPAAGVSASVGTLTNVSLVLSCYTCDGGSLAIYLEETTGQCVKDYSTPPSTPTCVPETTCFKHGCCAPISGVVTDVTPVGVCYCFSDSIRGYWSQSTSCSQCDAAHDSQGQGGPCTNSKSQIVVLLQTLGNSPAVMILPNLLVMVIFVLFGMIRPVWKEDANFNLTGLRRAGLSWSPQARRHSTVAQDDTADNALPIFREPFRYREVTISSAGGGGGGHASKVASPPRPTKASSMASSSPTAALSGPSTPHDDDAHPHTQQTQPHHTHARVGSSASVFTGSAQPLNQIPRSATGSGLSGAAGRAVHVDASQRTASSGAGGAGGDDFDIEYVRFHPKNIPPRPRGSVGIVARWESIRHARM